MKSYLVLLPIFLLALLESTIVPVKLTLLAIISWSVLRPGKDGLLTAFISGLILDFLTGKTLGSTSLFFLAVSLAVHLYKNRFQADRLAFLLPFTLAAVTVAYWLEGLALFSIRQLAETVLIVALLPVFDFLANLTKRGEELKLSL